MLCGREVWFVTLRKQPRLRVFKSRVLRKIFVPKWDEVKREWRKQHNEELCDLYSSAYTGCHRMNGPNFGRVFLMLNYTDITQNTYIQS